MERYLEVLIVSFFICKINCMCEYIIFEFLCILAFIKLGFFLVMDYVVLMRFIISKRELQLTRDIIIF